MKAQPCKVRHTVNYGPYGVFCKKHAEMWEYGNRWRKGEVMLKVPAFYIYLNWRNQNKKREKIRNAASSIVARRIQAAWKRAISDPNYKMCRDRLMREFHSSDPI